MPAGERGDAGQSIDNMSYLNVTASLLPYLSDKGTATYRSAGAYGQEPVSVVLTEIPVSIKRVLVLEDNFIIAMEAEDILKSLGIEHVEIATDLAQASLLIDAQSFDFALLDVNIGNETSFGFAEILMARGTLFGFVSGYGESSIFPVALRDIPRIIKPFNEGSMSSLLATTSSDRSSVGA